MSYSRDTFRLPFRITDFGPDMLVPLDKNLREIERVLGQLMLYEKQTGKPANTVVDGVTDVEGNLLTSKLNEKLVGLTNALQLAAAAITVDKLKADEVLSNWVFAGTVQAIIGSFSSLISGNLEGARLEMGDDSGPYLDMYDSNNKLRVEFREDSLVFRDPDGAVTGQIYGNPSAQTEMYSPYWVRIAAAATVNLDTTATVDGKGSVISTYRMDVTDGEVDYELGGTEIYSWALGGEPTVGGLWALLRVRADELLSRSYIDLFADYITLEAKTQVRSKTIYDVTTASAANVRVLDAGSFYALARSTSAKKYKKDIEPLEMQYAEAFLQKCIPVWFRSLCDVDNPKHGFYGYVADDALKVDPRIVDVDKDGNPEGFHYDRVGALLHVIVKDNRQRIELLEKENADLNQRLAKLEALVEGLKK